jgi:hypothetical protein
MTHMVFGQGMRTCSAGRRRRFRAVDNPSAGRKLVRPVEGSYSGRRLGRPRRAICRTAQDDFPVLQVFLVAAWQPSNRRPLVAQPQDFAHLVQKFRVRVVVPPAPGFAKFEEMLLPTLDQGEPSARDTVVQTLLRSRHVRARSARGFGASGYSACIVDSSNKNECGAVQA